MFETANSMINFFICVSLLRAGDETFHTDEHKLVLEQMLRPRFGLNSVFFGFVVYSHTSVGTSKYRCFFDLSLCFCFWNCTLLNPAKGAQSHFSSDLSEGSWTVTTCSIPPEPFALYFNLMSLRWMSGLHRSTSSRTFLISSPSLSGS